MKPICIDKPEKEPQIVFEAHMSSLMLLALWLEAVWLVDSRKIGHPHCFTTGFASAPSIQANLR